MFRYLFFFCFIFFFQACGTTGHIKFYNFSESKYDVEKELFRVIKKDSTYVVPAKWQGHTEGDYFERIYIYFKDQPEEMYQIGFTSDSTEWRVSSHSRLGLVSIYQGDKFKYAQDLFGKEIQRIQNRFEKEILNKIKFAYFKSD